MTITIFGELISSKNSKQIFINRKTGKRFPTNSKAAKKYIETAVPQLNAHRHQWGRMVADKPFPLRVEFKIYRKSKRIFDYINSVAQICDLMVAARYLPDDNADYLIPVFAPYEVDARNPRVEIRVL